MLPIPNKTDKDGKAVIQESFCFVCRKPFTSEKFGHLHKI